MAQTLTQTFYPHGYEYAREHGEIKEWTQERKIAFLAVKLFEEIMNSAYDGYSLNVTQAIRALNTHIGKQRALAILCSTINSAWSGDIRYTAKTREWASKPFGGNYVNENLMATTHPGLINLLAESWYTNASE